MKTSTKTETAAALAALRRQVQILYVIYTAIFVLAFGLVFSHMTISIMVALADVVFFVYVRSRAKLYAQKMNEARMQFGLCEGMQNFAAQKQPIITGEAFASLSFLPASEKGLLCKQNFSAQWGRFSVQGAEATFHFVRPNAKSGVKDYPFYSGTFLHFSAAKATTNATANDKTAFSNSITVMHSQLLDEQTLTFFCAQQGCTCTKVFYDETQHYLLLAKQPEVTLSAELQKQVSRFAKSCAGAWAAQITPFTANIFLKSRFYTQKYTPKTLPTEALICANPLEDRDACLTFAKQAMASFSET